MTNVTPQEFAAFIGLDWADAQHDVCLQVAGSDKREGKTLDIIANKFLRLPAINSEVV